MRTNFKKKLLIVAVLVVVAVTLLLVAACSPDKPDTKPTCNHVWNEWETDQPATCTEKGTLKRQCSKCGDVETMPEKELGHRMTEESRHEQTPASCAEDGVMAGNCQRCGVAFTESIPALGHDMQWTMDEDTHVKKCSRCNAQEGSPEQHSFNDDNQCTKCGYTRQTNTYYELSEDGKTLTFGTYPQSIVVDNALESMLNAEIQNKLPSESDPNGWTDYEYRISGSVQSFMWYIDIEYQNAKYRGVYFTEYRPSNTNMGSGESGSNQDENGYSPENVYWFKFEPITWRILTQQDGKAFVVADMILDCMEINSISNKYDESRIRTWLNNTFIETAFDEMEEYIVVTNVDNSAASTASTENANACDNTNDKVFLLSYAEVTNEDYGFEFSTRKFLTTAYALCQGAYANTSGYGWVMLRSPSDEDAFDMLYITHIGYVSAGTSRRVNETICGTVPALWLTL